MIEELVRKNRSYRRFYQDPVSMETLHALVDLARLTSSGKNAQPLKYILSCDPAKNAIIYPTLAWAGYLKEWGGPQEDERPTAYIVILGDKEIVPNFGIDPGLATQSIMLGAVERGLGGCIIATIQRTVLNQVLNIPEKYETLLVLALGKPKEEVVIEPMPESGDIKYWRDEKQIHHVPKRALADLILDL